MGRAQIWDGAEWVDMTGGSGSEGGDFSGNHADLTNVQPGQHHLRYADSEAVSAMNPINNVNPLNHNRYTDAEARAAVDDAISGLLLDSNYQSGSDAPGNSETTLLSYTVSGMAGKLITVDVQATLRSSAMDEGEGFEGRIVIDGSAFPNARTQFGNVTASSHTHFMSAKSTGVTDAHVHQEGDYSTNGTTVTINVSDGRSTVTPIALRTFTPTGNFSVTLQGLITAGAPGTWFESLIVKVFSA